MMWCLSYMESYAGVLIPHMVPFCYLKAIRKGILWEMKYFQS
jgi:hypothetical protein